MTKMKRRPLSEEEWIIICKMRYEKREIQEIAQKILRPLITVERALNRFDPPPYYSYADWEKLGRHYHGLSKKNKGRRGRARLKSPFILEYVKSGLEKKWSPEQISLRLRIDHPGLSISYEAIYDWIVHDPEGKDYEKYLVRGISEKKRGAPGSRKLKGRKPKDREKVSIEHRPASAEDRTSDGAQEVDLIIGKGRSCLLVLVNRKTRRVWLRKIKSKESMVVMWALMGILKTLPEEERRTITSDNGTEFAKWREVENLMGIWFYFCHVYCPFEKGTVENRNGVIRGRFFKKGTDFDNVSHEEIREVELWMNTCPIKLHGGYSALEIEARLRKEREDKRKAEIEYKLAA